jgi:predicted nucleic acid-binding protein
MNYKMREAIAVADSGPLIALVRIGQLELLPRIFSEVTAPPEVWHEITEKGRGLPGAYEISQVKWIKIQAPLSQLVQPLSILVDAGEAQAIALAQTTPDCIILLDDARARKIAERLSIKQIGTIGLLLRAKRMGLIEKIRPHIEALIKNGIYIRQQLIDAVLKEAGE